MLRHRSQKGSTLIEFAFIAFVLIAVLLAGLEVDRFLLTYTTVANAARAGVRYAVVNGYWANGQSSDTTSTKVSITNVVKTFAGMALLDTSTLPQPRIIYTPNNNIGSRVSVTVYVPYKPLSTYFPLQVTLTSTAEGTICY